MIERLHAQGAERTAMSIEAQKLFAEGDTVAFRFILQGTHLGTFARFPYR
jgi:hypothetical protein